MLFKIQKIKFYNLWMLYNYIAVRYKVFVQELQRPMAREFRSWDAICNHYLLLEDNIAVGTARLHYTNGIAELGRIAILKDYRSKGYASLAINQLINHVKEEGRAPFIQLFTHQQNVIFYRKFGFSETEIRFFEGDPYPYRTMILCI